MHSILAPVVVVAAAVEEEEQIAGSADGFEPLVAVAVCEADNYRAQRSVSYQPLRYHCLQVLLAGAVAAAAGLH